jgi:glycosyltransferase involved in cell wall biosynthesis
MLSVCVITLNEAQRIGACLESVPFADEWVVLDSGSTDNTVQICAERGARVIVEPFRGFGLQKNRCFELARGDWILSLDADERLSPELAQEIQAALAAPGTAAGFAFPRRNIVAGRPMLRGGPFHNWPDWALRLFRRGHGRCREVEVHEGMQVSGPVRRLRAPLLHYAYDSYAEMLRAMDRYATLGAIRTYREGCHLRWRGSSVHAVLRASLTFFHKFVLRAGFWDGGHGLAGASAAAWYVFLKYAKLGELVDLARGGKPLDEKLHRWLLPPQTGASGPRPKGS